MLSEELLTKEDFHRALRGAEELLKEASKNLLFSKKQIRQCYTRKIRTMLQHDIKNKECQIAFLISHNPDVEAVIENLEENQATYERLLRIRDDIIRLMSMTQSEMKI